MLEPIEIEIIEGILDKGEIASDEVYSAEIIVECIIVKYYGEVYEVVKHDGDIVNFTRLY